MTLVEHHKQVPTSCPRYTEHHHKLTVLCIPVMNCLYYGQVERRSFCNQEYLQPYSSNTNSTTFDYCITSPGLPSLSLGSTTGASRNHGSFTIVAT